MNELFDGAPVAELLVSGTGNECGVVRPVAETAPLRQARPARRTGDEPASDSLYAALDLGTNNCRLLVAQPTRRSFRVVDAFSRIVRLGEDLDRRSALGDAAQSRAIEALKVCRDKLISRGVTRSRLIATEACRRAANGMEFIDRVQRETGLKLEVVDRETEARLAVAGCASLVDPAARGAIVFDIGGGSTELVWLDFDGQCWPGPLGLQKRVAAWTSMPLGVVTLAEKFGGVAVGPEDFEEMVSHVRETLERFEAREIMVKALAEGDVHLLGTSGTVTTICGVHLALDRYDRRKVDGTWMRGDDVVAVTERLLGMTFEERVKNPCIGPDRADLVLAGCAIFEAIRREWPCRRIRVADRGLREGILMSLMARDGVWRNSRGRRARRGRRRQQPA
ncbi:Ppx/GppA phosphatase family protein [Lutibaculum baratangense]|uniref:Exopolyphosphatase n=1 Tax=Lutibaculum baratangense AMV1 TaxID=631454 RepID=V4QUK8_9HYPH|nr:Ppx/GppA phosphatase family protein [Lutibaculum baratangense]ESR23412.1 Exopolyphosphatase [Lutibaculum baratangense AMV1]